MGHSSCRSCFFRFRCCRLCCSRLDEFAILTIFLSGHVSCTPSCIRCSCGGHFLAQSPLFNPVARAVWMENFSPPECFFSLRLTALSTWFFCYCLSFRPCSFLSPGQRNMLEYLLTCTLNSFFHVSVLQPIPTLSFFASGGLTDSSSMTPFLVVGVKGGLTQRFLEVSVSSYPLVDRAFGGRWLLHVPIRRRGHSQPFFCSSFDFSSTGP